MNTIPAHIARALRVIAEAMFPELKPTVAIPTCETCLTLPLLSGMLEVGHVHTSHDGLWRYSPGARDGTVYIDSPTKLFPRYAECGRGWQVWADKESGIYLCRYGDGTSGAYIWDAEVHIMRDTMFPARHEAERTMRAFLWATFMGEGA